MNNQLKSFQDGYKIVYRRVYDEETGQEYKEDSYFPDEEFKWKRFSENLSANVIFILFYSKLNYLKQTVSS